MLVPTPLAGMKATVFFAPSEVKLADFLRVPNYEASKAPLDSKREREREYKISPVFQPCLEKVCGINESNVYINM